MQCIKFTEAEGNQYSQEGIPTHWEIDQAKIDNIRDNILLLQQIFQRNYEGDRNLLNKWFQDSVKNYILECYAAPLLRPKMAIH